MEVVISSLQGGDQRSSYPLHSYPYSESPFSTILQQSFLPDMCGTRRAPVILMTRTAVRCTHGCSDCLVLYPPVSVLPCDESNLKVLQEVKMYLLIVDVSKSTFPQDIHGLVVLLK